MAGIFGLNKVTFIVPKNRKPKFDLTLRILDLNNVPLVYGAAYVKWNLPSSSGAEHRGHTDRAYIKDHKAIWDYNKELSVRLTIDKHHNLQECIVEFEVIQEYFENTREGRIPLGTVKLNLAEYAQALDSLGVIASTTTNSNGQGSTVDEKDDSEEGMITRRYLMQDSKINATLRLGIRMKQIDGDTNYMAPPLKSAMVLGGIAGIMNAEAGESEDMPTLTSKSRELSEGQDIYRRTLAASWSCQFGELPPDRLIEDLFAGGDGGKMEPPATPRGHRGFRHGMNRGSIDASTSDSDSRRPSRPNLLSPEDARTDRRGSRNGGHHGYSNSQTSMGSAVSGRGSIEQQAQHSHTSRRSTETQPHDLTEFELRDDLRSWQVRVK